MKAQIDEDGISPQDKEKMKEEALIEKEAAQDGTSPNEGWIPPTPFNALEYNHSITVPAWGEVEYYSPEAQDILHKSKPYLVDMKNDTVVEDKKEPLLQYLQVVLKKDLRLGNLNEMLGEINYCKEHLDFAYDCIDSEFPESSQLCIERAASMIELSHSKGGFFRKLIHTITKRESKTINEPNQKSLIGAPRKDTEDY